MPAQSAPAKGALPVTFERHGIKVLVAGREIAARLLAVEMINRILAVQIHRRFVLGTATGATPILLYQMLRTIGPLHGVDFTRIICIGLDEYCGLPPRHPLCYDTFMRDNFWEPGGQLLIPEGQRHLPDPNSTEPLGEEMTAYEKLIRNTDGGGIDLQILGIGGSCHIGFNEPGSSRNSRTRRVKLHPRTLKDAKREFKDSEPPEEAVTMGVATILEATSIRMMAFGEAKAEAISHMLAYPPSNAFPASHLQGHKDAYLIADEDALSLLRR